MGYVESLRIGAIMKTKGEKLVDQNHQHIKDILVLSNTPHVFSYLWINGVFLCGEYKGITL